MQSTSRAAAALQAHLVHLLGRRVVQHLQALGGHDAHVEDGLRQMQRMRERECSFSEPPRSGRAQLSKASPNTSQRAQRAQQPTLNAGSSKQGNARRADEASNCVVASVCSVPPRLYVLLQAAEGGREGDGCQQCGTHSNTTQPRLCTSHPPTLPPRLSPPTCRSRSGPLAAHT